MKDTRGEVSIDSSATGSSATGSGSASSALLHAVAVISPLSIKVAATTRVTLNNISSSLLRCITLLLGALID
jgi:hypothetical protein